MKSFYCYEYPVGPVVIAEADGRIVYIGFSDRAKKDKLKGKDVLKGYEKHETPGIGKAAKQLMEYFAGKRKEFDLPLEFIGTAFQKKVWAELMEIPYGGTGTYGELAKRIGSPGSARAVGMANNRNPIVIICPCHRVIGADGSLTGYGGGLANKELLLKLEGKT